MSIRLAVRLLTLVYVSVSVSTLPVLSSPVRFFSVQCSVCVLLVLCFAFILVFSLVFAVVFSIVSSLVLVSVSLLCLVYVRLGLVHGHVSVLSCPSLASPIC